MWQQSEYVWVLCKHESTLWASEMCAGILQMFNFKQY